MVAAASLATTRAGAWQRAGAPAEIGWVALYDNDLIDWLENENRLKELCPDVAGDEAGRDRCRAEKLQSRPFVVPLRTAPADSAASAGSLLLLATPGKGLRCFYVPTTGGAPREFTPDLYLQDWGYGPYFHETYLDRRGNWFLLPEEPFPAGTWIDADSSEPRLLAVGEIVNGPGGSLFILGIEPDIIRARPEQRADMWCESEPAPALSPWTEIRIPRRDLYSPSGHLLVAPKYLKGC